MKFLSKDKRVAGFSITELMVVVGIIAILGVIGLGAYDSFRANARRAEVSSNLAFINKLQITYQQRFDRYWDGTDTGNGGNAVMSDEATGYGYRGAGSATCQQNSLGFRLKNCDELRYRYWIVGADTGNYVAVGWALSDAANWLYPRCTGEAIAGQNQTLITRNGNATGTPPAATAGGCNDLAAINQTGIDAVDVDSLIGTGNTIDQGDAWCVGPQGTQINLLDIVETCSQ